MIEGKSVLGVILARGGSKELPRKNVREMAGKPLIAWTIEDGHQSEYVDRLILSSDDEEIMRVGKEWGGEVPFQRPAALAEDNTSSIDALLHAVNEMPPHDLTVLLQPTSPLRVAADVDAVLRQCIDTGAPACVSVVESGKPPQWMYTIDSNYHLHSILPDKEIERRQEAQSTYVLNGAVYAGRTEWLQRTRTFRTDETVAYEMPPERSKDVDDQTDFICAEALLQNRQ